VGIIMASFKIMRRGYNNARFRIVGRDYINAIFYKNGV